MSHTPGPWYAVDNGHYIDINIADGLYYPSVANVIPSKFLESGDNSKANADLIAAAPDMLTALRQAEEELVELYRGIAPKGDFASRSPTVQTVRAAIEKAEGRS